MSIEFFCVLFSLFTSCYAIAFPLLRSRFKGPIILYLAWSFQYVRPGDVSSVCIPRPAGLNQGTARCWCKAILKTPHCPHMNACRQAETAEVVNLTLSDVTLSHAMCSKSTVNQVSLTSECFTCGSFRQETSTSVQYV